MNVTELLIEAGILMSVGMFVVFVFLTMLIFAIKVLTKFSQAYPDPVVVAPTSISPKSSSTKTSPQVIAAISAAVHQYRNKNK